MHEPSRQVDPSRAQSVLEIYLAELLADVGKLDGGEVATYIPELGRADPERFGICIATVDGKVYTVGDADHTVTIQSVSKPFMYGLALEARGRTRVLEQVGVEPTGETFNAIVLDEATNRPFNPMVNAGAIAISELMCGPDRVTAAEAMRANFSRFAGRELEIDLSVFESEHKTGHRNRAIAWLMLNSNMIERDPDEVLDLYFRQCSVLVSTRDLAVMAATLAAHGRNPLSGETVISPDTTRDVLSVMSSAGMYDYAGQWAFDVGLPAKSGVSGLIAAVVPGQFGLAVYAPRLDSVGNSVRGVEVCRRFSERFGLHVYGERSDLRQVIRREYTAAQVQSRRARDARETSLLKASGSRFVVMDLQGLLNFGAVERVVRRISELPADTETIALDFRRVAMVDKGGLELLREFFLAQDRPELLLTEVEHRVALANLATLVRGLDGASRLQMVTDADNALEQHEEAVLTAADAKSEARRFRLADQEIFAGLDKAEIAAIENIASAFSFDSGQVLMKAGDPASAFLIIAKGTVSISVDLPRDRSRRVASIGPGQVIGEMALIDGGPRSANVTADGPVTCYAFSLSSIEELKADHPMIMEKILRNVVLSLTLRLRRTNDELRAFE